MDALPSDAKEPAMTWRDLLHIRLTEAWGVEVTLGIALVLTVVVVLVAYCVVKFIILRKSPRFDVVEAEIKLGAIGSVKIKPSYEDVQIAHRAWVELVTRKAALPFDEEYDVIVEVYDSWYQLFGRIRDLIKDIPAQKLRSSRDTQELVRIMVDALNKGLRPHLTRWQARFRRWYETQLTAQQDVPPQTLQRRFPEYDALVKDLKAINQQILEYAELLRRISHG
jgi:hypothetical protein